METYFLVAGIALCLFSLWALARHDWLRLTRPARQAIGTVVGHRTGLDEGQRTYAPIYRFVAEDGEHEVIDPVYSRRANPDIGTVRTLSWPEGHPDLARPPRPLLWAVVYLFLTGTAVLLLAKLFGWLQG